MNINYRSTLFPIKSATVTLQGGLIRGGHGKFWKKLVSNMGTEAAGGAELEAVDIKVLEALVNNRLKTETKTRVSVALGDVDFQPAHFLQSGASRGRAVCRLAREFSKQEFEAFVEGIQKGEDISDFDSVDKLKEIFSIPDSVAIDIFSEKNVKGAFGRSKKIILDLLNEIIQDIKNSYQEATDGLEKTQLRSEQQFFQDVQDVCKNYIDNIIHFVPSLGILTTSVSEAREKIQQWLDELGSQFPEAIEFYSNLEETNPSSGVYALDVLVLVSELAFRAGVLGAFKEIDESKLAKLNPIPIGTGFLVGGNHLLTNHHVVSNIEEAEQCVAQFNYVKDASGYTQTSTDYLLSPRDLFVTNPALDYTLVQLKAGLFTQPAGYVLGWIPLVELSETVLPGRFILNANQQEQAEIVSYVQEHLYKQARQNIQNEGKQLDEANEIGTLDKSIEKFQAGYSLSVTRLSDQNWLLQVRHPKLSSREINAQILRLSEQSISSNRYGIDNLKIRKVDGDPVYIIQHPKGRQQQIVIRDNRVLYDGLYTNFLHYRADSDYGSSGSPVFNAQWQLVALHHAAISAPIGNIDAEKQAALQNIDSSQASEVIAQQGVRIHAIISDLKQKSAVLSQLRSFIDNYVVTTEQLNYPPLPVALEFDGVRSCVCVDGEVGITFAGTRPDGTVDLTEWSMGGFQLSTTSMTASDAVQGENVRNRVWLSGDGRLAAVAVREKASSSGDHYIEIRDRDGGRLRTIAKHLSPVTSASFSSDGKKLITGDTEGEVKVWECQTGNELTSYSNHIEIRVVAFSPVDKDNREKIIIGDDSGNLAVFELEKRGGTLGEEALSWSLSRQFILAAVQDYDGIRFERNGPIFRPDKLAFSADGRIMGAIDSATAMTMEAQSHIAIPSFGVAIWELTVDSSAPRYINAVSPDFYYYPDFDVLRLSPNGRIVAALVRTNACKYDSIGPYQSHGGDDGTPSHVRVWNADGELLSTLRDHNTSEYARQFKNFVVSPDSRLIVTATEDWSENRTIGINFWSHDGRLLNSDLSYKNDYSLKSAVSWAAMAECDFPMMCFAPPSISFENTPMVIAIATNKEIHLFKVKWENQRLQVLPLLNEPVAEPDKQASLTAMCFSPDGTKLATSSHSDKQGGQISIWNISTGRKEKQRNLSDTESAVNHLAFSPDGELIAYTTVKADGYEGGPAYSQILRLWHWKKEDANETNVIQELEHRNDTEEDEHTVQFFFNVRFFFSADNQQLSSYNPKSIRVWQKGAGWGAIDPNPKILLNRNDYASIKDARFSSDSKEIIFAEGKTINRWKYQESNHARIISTHSHEITHFDINFAGSMVATAVSSRSIKTWKADGKLHGTISDIHLITALEFTSMNQLITADEAGGTKLWPEIQPGNIETLQSGKQLKAKVEKRCHNDSVLSIDIGYTTRIMASVGRKGDVELWQVIPKENNTHLAQIKSLSSPVMLSPSSSDGYVDGQLRINLDNHRLKQTIAPYSFGSKPFSVEAWINPSLNGFGGTVVSKWCEDNQGEYLVAVTSKGKVVFSRLASGVSQQLYTVESERSITFGVFHHVVASFDGQAMRLYINGQLLEQRSFEFTAISLAEENVTYDGDGQIFSFKDSWSRHFELVEIKKENDFRLQLKEGKLEWIEGERRFQAKRNTFSVNIVPQPEIQQPSSDASSDAKTTIHKARRNQTIEAEDGRLLTIGKIELTSTQLTVWTDGLYAESQQNAEQSNPLTLDLTPTLIGAHFKDAAQIKSSDEIITGFFKGIIADVRIWNKEVSSEEIQKNMHRRLNAEDNPSLVGYWRFEDGIGDRVNNLSATRELSPSYGKAIETKWLNASQFPTPPLPFSLKFNGKDAYIDCKDVPQVKQAITVEAWVKHAYGDGLIVHRGGGWTDSGYSLRWHRSKIRVELQNVDLNTKLTIDTQKNAPSDNAWHHIAFSWSGEGSGQEVEAAQEVEVYVDGQRQNVIAVTGESKNILSGGLYKSVGIFQGSVGSQSKAMPLTIGGMKPGQTVNKQESVIYFDGSIAEVRLWSVARTQNQIKANLYRRLDADTEQKKGLIGYWRLDEEITMEEDSAKNEVLSSKKAVSQMKVRNRVGENVYATAYKSQRYRT